MVEIDRDDSPSDSTTVFRAVRSSFYFGDSVTVRMSIARAKFFEVLLLRPIFLMITDPEFQSLMLLKEGWLRRT